MLSRLNLSVASFVDDGVGAAAAAAVVSLDMMVGARCVDGFAARFLRQNRFLPARASSPTD